MVFAKLLVHPLTVALTWYSPALAIVTFEIELFCVVAVNALGPVQAYVAPGMADADKFKLLPVHNAPLFVAAGGLGVALIFTDVDAFALEHPLTVTNALYIPAFASDAFCIDGFWAEDIKPFGPVQV